MRCLWQYISVQGIFHETKVGDVKKNSSQGGLELPFDYNNNSQKGTEYAISGMTFKKDYKYIIKITAKNNNYYNPAAGLRLNFNPSGIDPFCNGPNFVSFNNGTFSSSNNGFQQVINTSYAEYTFESDYLSTAQNSMGISTYSLFQIASSTQFKQTIYIKKIEIFEILPPPSFTLSPISVSLTCGDTSSKSFSVTPANIPIGANVTYSWSHSGWSLVSSTGTSRTLQPNSGTALPSSVSVTPYINGVAQATKTSTVSRAPFTSSLTILGPTSLCNSANYSINTSGTNIQVISWSVSNPGIASISGNGNQATLTATGNGRVTITATLQNACGQNTTISTPEIFIGTGLPALTTGFDVMGSNYHYTVSGGYIKNFSVCPNEYLDITPKPYMQDIIEHQWTVTGNYQGSYNPSASVLSITTSFQVGATLQISYRARNACGWGAWINGSFQNMDCDNGEEPWFVYPNPATETLTIESSHNPDTMEKSTQKPDQRYTLYDFNGTIVQRGWLNNKTTLDVTKLKKGRYVLKLEVGGNKEIVRHIVIN